MTQKSKTPAATGALDEGFGIPAPKSDSPSIPNRKPVPFRFEGELIKPRGGLARLLGMMIDAGLSGIDRHMCSEWCADLPASICKLRKRQGLDIETVKGKPTRYVLRSPVSHDRRGQ